MRAFPRRRWSSAAVTLAIALGVIAAADAAAPDANSGEAPFPAENRVAMDKMMAGMDTVTLLKQLGYWPFGSDQCCQR